MSVAAITGASAGIGEALAQVYAKQRYHLFLGARRIDRLESMRASLLAQGAASVEYAQLDVCSDSSVKTWSEKAFSTHPKVDILINNAGLVLGLDPIEKGQIADWETIFDTNVLGVLRICRQFIPRFRQQNSGHIIMIGSIAGHQVYEGGGPYCASKFSIKALTKTLKLELNGTPIRISSVDPGMVETEFSLVRFRGDKQKASQVYQGLTPLRAKDIAECVEFVSSRPAHVNIDEIIVMPTAQASVYKVHRQS